MTIKLTIAAVAAVSSAVIFSGQSAHAEMNNPFGSPPNFNPGNPVQMQMPTPVMRPPAGFTPPQAPAPVFAQPSMPQAQPPQSNNQAPASSAPSSSNSSNTYVKGQCTWYAKSRRPDLPNRLGNGGQWTKNAAARGYSTGTTPRAGAIAEQAGHVAYVESVSGSTVTVSEMNYNGGVGKVHTRTVSASTFTSYIY